MNAFYVKCKLIWTCKSVRLTFGPFDFEFIVLIFCLFLVEAISEVEFKGGVAYATSNHDPNTWKAANAFILGHAYGWHIKPSENGMFPQLVWYEFPANKAFVPARVSFRPRKDAGWDQVPTMWQYVGSNDPNCKSSGNWTILCEDLSDAGYRTKFTTKYCKVDDQITRKFRCLGIMVLNTHSGGGSVALKDVRMWKKLYL